MVVALVVEKGDLLAEKKVLRMVVLMVLLLAAL